MKLAKISLMAILASFVTLGINQTVQAQDFVYNPINPAFGGAYYNYSWLMNSANTQNEHQETYDRFGRDDPLADFENQLQRQVLSQLTREIVLERFGEVNLQEENSFSFGEYNINIRPGSDGISIGILNEFTGEETSVTIPNY